MVGRDRDGRINVRVKDSPATREEEERLIETLARSKGDVIITGNLNEKMNYIK